MYRILSKAALPELIEEWRVRATVYAPVHRGNLTEFGSVEAGSSSQVVLGIRACDARASQLLDGVFTGGDYPDPYWASKRERTTLVALGCNDPCETCFCTAVGSGPFDRRGADVMLIDVGNAYVADIQNEKGQAFLEGLSDASQDQIDTAWQI